MDYLPRPKDATVPPIEIELGNIEKYWSDADWETYSAGTHWTSFPQRCGYPNEQWWCERDDPVSLNEPNATRFFLCNDLIQEVTYDQAAAMLGVQVTPRAAAHFSYTAVTSPCGGQGELTPGFRSWLASKPKDELRDVALAWLYFGVLAEVCQCRLHLRKYCKETGDGRRILCMTGQDLHHIFFLWWSNVKYLPGSVLCRGDVGTFALQVHPDQTGALPNGMSEVQCTEDDWTYHHDHSLRFAKLDEHGRNLAFERFGACLMKATHVLWTLAPDYLDQEVTFVISCLYETLARFARDVFEGEVLEKYLHVETFGTIMNSMLWASNQHFSQYISDNMERLGWCPCTINAFTTSTSRMLAAEYFAVNTKSPQTDEDHSKCTSKMCLAYQLDEQSYPRVHIGSTGCSCVNLGINLEVSETILEESSNNYPLVRVAIPEGADTMPGSLEILSSASAGPYVAVSHVWSHGLGNPQENSLPACQLRRLQGLVNSLEALVFGQQHTDGVPFWIDTLCVPRKPKRVRKLAIKRMSATYRNAKHVLVVDKNLCALTTSELNTLEILTHINNSVWTTRLWTLSEARLAKENLWFQFKDRVVSLLGIFVDFQAWVRQPMTLGVAYADPMRPLVPLYNAVVLGINAVAMARLLGLTQSSLSGSSGVDGAKVADALARTQDSLHGRSTSHASDEAICLCTFLDKEVGPVLEFDTPELRMAAFWRQWPAITQGMIFNDFPRLQQKGLRWAPETFLRGEKTKRGWLLPPKALKREDLVKFDASGLLVRMFGFRFKYPSTGRWLQDHLAQRSAVGASLVAKFGKDRNRLFDRTNDLIATSNGLQVHIGEPVHAETPETSLDQPIAIIVGADSMDGALDRGGRPALLVSIREDKDDILYVTSLCHAWIFSQSDESSLVYGVALHARGPLRDSMSYFDNSWRTRENLHEVDKRLETAMRLPEVKATVEDFMYRNPDSHLAKTWRAASAEDRQNFEFRRTEGDIQWFREKYVVREFDKICWLAELPQTQRWCVD